MQNRKEDVPLCKYQLAFSVAQGNIVVRLELHGLQNPRYHVLEIIVFLSQCRVNRAYQKWCHMNVSLKKIKLQMQPFFLLGKLAYFSVLF